MHTPIFSANIPKDVQIAVPGAEATQTKAPAAHRNIPQMVAPADQIAEAVEMIENAERPILYTGGGVINSGPEATKALRALQKTTGFPVTSTLMGLGAFPASHPDWLGMLGMHGSYEANNAMHDCDLMICVGARFDDRVTGRIDAFSPGSRKIHIDIDPQTIGRTYPAEVGIVAALRQALGDLPASLSKEHSRVAWDKRTPWLDRLPTTKKGWEAKITNGSAAWRAQV